MNETPKVSKDFKKLADVIANEFPDLQCLRCGHDGFFLSTDLSHPTMNVVGEVPDIILRSMDAGIEPITTLVCRKCGYIEQHLTSILLNMKQEKPEKAT